MPIYEFICDNCNLKFEKIYSKIHDKKKETCPNCNLEADRVISLVNHHIAESKMIPKDIDKKVGADADKRWLEYEERKKIKDKVRQDAGTLKLSKDPDGNYAPFTMKKNGQEVDEKEGVQLRKEMFKTFSTIIHDPQSKKFEVKDA